jgi:heme-degrading monooxygenase HmoA
MTAESLAYDAAMIARIWRGAVRREDRAAYADYIRETGIAGYEATPGNRGAWMLIRDVGERSEFVTFTFWDSFDAIRAFAGEDVDAAVYYPEDDRYLVEREDIVEHYDVDGPD